MTCPICPRTTKPVLGHGPCPAKTVAIGERPGLAEMKQRIPFVGPSGMEWNSTYLPLAGLNRPDVYVTNTVKCFAKDNRTPTAKEIAACSQYWLPQELDKAQPEVVFLMGASACSLAENISLDVDHGRPQRRYLYGRELWICPMYHPALGLHDTSWMSTMLADWTRLKPWLADGTWVWPEDGYPNPDYQLADTEEDVDYYFESHWQEDWDHLAIDTETHAGKLFSIQVSVKPGTGLMVKAKTEAESRLREFIGGPVIFHNAPADLPFFDDLDITSYRDTMVEAYHLGLPQSLKVLGWQLFGVRMQSWDDLVGKCSRGQLMEWLAQRLEEEAQRPDIIPIERHRGRRLLIPRTVEQPNPLYKKLERIFHHGIRSDTYDAESRLRALGLEIPEKGIGHCPEDAAVRYGCADADLTLRLALKLDQLRQELNDFGVTAEDCDG